MLPMNNVRIDTVDMYYKVAARGNIASNIFLAGSILGSFAVFFLNGHPELKNYANIFFVVLTILYFVASNMTSLYFLRRAENKRTTHLLSNSLGVSLDDEETNIYYNNEQVSSVARLGLNIFENSLHSSATTSAMLQRETFKVAGYIVVWFICMLNRNTPLDLIAIISQTLLATTILVNYIKILVLKIGFEGIFKECRTLFLHGIQNNDLFNAQIIDVFVRYESLKASMGVLLSSTLFFKANQSTSAEWNRVKNNLGL